MNLVLIVTELNTTKKKIDPSHPTSSSTFQASCEHVQLERERLHFGSNPQDLQDMGTFSTRVTKHVLV
jgi:hypothetical protein